MKDCCWVIKVTFLDFKNDVNFNEGYWHFEDCMRSILRKVEGNEYERINNWTVKDLDENIIYEAKLVDIF